MDGAAVDVGRVDATEYCPTTHRQTYTLQSNLFCAVCVIALSAKNTEPHASDCSAYRQEKGGMYCTLERYDSTRH